MKLSPASSSAVPFEAPVCITDQPDTLMSASVGLCSFRSYVVSLMIYVCVLKKITMICHLLKK